MRQHVQNAITEASGTYTVVSRFPRKHVVMVIPLNDNPRLANPALVEVCIEQIKVAYPRIVQMDATIEFTSTFGRVLKIVVKGW